MAVTAIPGLATGRTTLVRADQLLHPSTNAASSSSFGMSSKKARASQTERGRLNVKSAITSPWYVSISLAPVKSSDKGIAVETGGIIRVDKIHKAVFRPPRN